MKPRTKTRFVALALLLALAAWGCSDDGDPGSTPADGGGGTEASVNPADDKDKDGYTVAQGDCDDNDPKINPGAKENCTDGIDNNCNGAKDTYEPDSDYDGFGPCQGDCDDTDQAIGPAMKEIAGDKKDNNCDGITDADFDMDGQTEAAGDCNDNDATVYKGAIEDCYDGKDNDCNKYTDSKEPDKDGDGYGPCSGDCDDKDKTINPGAKEIAGDKKDNDCDGMVDVDIDGDGWTVANGDCDDNNAKAYPGAKVDCNSTKDLNCNKLPDNQETTDLDNDGVGACKGDCDDYDARVRPGFIEIPGDKLDNDCDGKVDNVKGCDCSGTLSEAQAMDLCDSGLVITVGGDAKSRAIKTGSWGAIKPRRGCSLYTISTGQAFSTSPQTGSQMYSNGNPVKDTGCMKCTIPGASKYIHPGPSGCCEDRTENDTSWLKIEATVPINAKGLMFDFLFLSSEYPEFVKSNYNDTFYVVAKTSALTSVQNVSFDKAGQPLTVNNGWFENPSNPTQSIKGTGYDAYKSGQPVGSSSGWLTTFVPVKPKETVTLTFWIHDEGDRIYDSAVVIDNLRWSSTSNTAPSTIK